MRIILPILFFFLTPLLVDAAIVSYSRDPSGSGDFSTVDFTVDIGDYTNCDFNNTIPFDVWRIDAWDNTTSSYIPSSEVIGSFSGTVTITGFEGEISGIEITKVSYLGGTVGLGTCAEVEGDYSTPLFNLILPVSTTSTSSVASSTLSYFEGSLLSIILFSSVFIGTMFLVILFT